MNKTSRYLQSSELFCMEFKNKYETGIVKSYQLYVEVVI